MKKLMVVLGVYMASKTIGMCSDGCTWRGVIGVCFCAALATIIIMHGKEDEKHA